MPLAPLRLEAPTADPPWLRDAADSLAGQGFAIIPNAVRHELVDAYRAEIAALLARPSGLVVAHADQSTPAEAADLTVPLSKLLDPYVFAPSALPLMFADSIQALLAHVFNEGVLAFQGLHFEVGSTQAIHQDTAYIFTSEPSRFLASWIALEDIEPGSGELIYYPGSHQWPLKWDHSRPWGEAHSDYIMSLPEQAKAHGVQAASFHARKGDALIWHPDLAHGGGPITRPGTTRRSLVTHYCGLSDTPRYFRLPERAFKASIGTGSAISSRHYDLRRSTYTTQGA